MYKPPTATREALNINARNMGSMIDRVLRKLTADDIKHISNTYHQWQKDDGFEDVAEYCKSVELVEIASQTYIDTHSKNITL